MANIIDFKARGFKLVEGCSTNRGNRLIVTGNDESVSLIKLTDARQVQI